MEFLCVQLNYTIRQVFLGIIKEDALPVIAGFKISRISGYELAAYHP
jgi:hypothetical protein